MEYANEQRRKRRQEKKEKKVDRSSKNYDNEKEVLYRKPQVAELCKKCNKFYKNQLCTLCANPEYLCAKCDKCCEETILDYE